MIWSISILIDLNNIGMNEISVNKLDLKNKYIIKTLIFTQELSENTSYLFLGLHRILKQLFRENQCFCFADF